MPQRRFVDAEEREGVFETVRQRGMRAKTLESETQMFAGLCIAAKPGQFEALTECVTEVRLHDRPGYSAGTNRTICPPELCSSSR